MPRLKRTEYPTEFKVMRNAASYVGENNDCAVVAVALLCRAPHDEVTELSCKLGRTKGKGTSWSIIRKMFAYYGYEFNRMNKDHFISQYPKPHCDVLKNITTHHPRRFPGVFNDGNEYLLDCRLHVAALQGGEVKDWSINNSLRVSTVYIVKKVQ
jgi:hypothetical protein